MSTPIEDPFWNGGGFTPGERVDVDTMSSLQVLHTLCGQLAAAVAGAAADRDRHDNLFALLNHLADGTVGEFGAHGFTWDSLLFDQHWQLTRLYAAVALDYAWAASRIAGKLATAEGPVVPLRDWSDNERHPGPDWITANPGRRVFPVQLPSPDGRLGSWYAGQIAELGGLLTDVHQRMHDMVVRVLKVHPDDLRGRGLPWKEPRLTQDDRAEAEPRRARLQEAAAELHAYAAVCARAVVLLNVADAAGGRDGQT